MERSRIRKFLLAGTVMALAAFTAAPAQGSVTGGVSPGEQGARWWEWAFSIPVDWSDPASHPLTDETGGNCGVGQPEGGPFYLAGVFNTSGVAVRNDCVVPEGARTFAPAINVECSSLEGGIFYGGNAKQLKNCLKRYTYTGGFAHVDGAPVPLVYSRSGVYDIHMPDTGDNILGAAPGADGISMAEGLYLQLAPLSPGEHTVHFGGTINYNDPDPANDWSWTLDITYNLTVA
jgi:hypothetical protein